MRNPSALLGAILKRLTARTSQLATPRAPQEPLPLAVALEHPLVPVPDLSLLVVRVATTGELRVEGFCSVQGPVRPDEVKVTHAWLRGASESAAGDVSQAAKSPLPNLMSKNSHHDLADSGFIVLFEGFNQTQSQRYVVEVGVEFEHVCVIARFSQRYERGSAGALGARPIGPGVFLQSAWDARLGLQITVAPGAPALETSGASFRNGRCALQFEAPADFEPRRARWTNGVRGPALKLAMDPGGNRVASVDFDTAALTKKRFARQPRGIELIGADRSTRLLHGGLKHLAADWLIPGINVVIAPDRDGVLRFVRAEPQCNVESVDVVDAGRELVVRGRLTGPPPNGITLKGARIETRGVIATRDSHEFTCRLPLHAVGWLGQDRTLPSGGYWIEADYGDAKPRKLTVSRVFEQALPRVDRNEGVHVRIERDQLGQIAIAVAAPLDDNEVGAPGRKAVTAPANRSPIIKDALYLESWFGKSFSDSPAPLADALRDDFKDIYVGVSDHSVEVPDHVKPVIVGSSAWWEAVTSSRIVVDNSWIPAHFKRRRGQKVVQTWHGTPLKKLGFDRSQHEGRASTPKSFAWGSAKWDLLVSPNAYSTEIFRRAYTYDGRVAEIGYPRNDILVAGGGIRDQVRTALGLSTDETVVVYAPTFREGQSGRSAFCDVEALARKLGGGYRLVVRGHSATLRAGADHRAANVLDVTSYPDSSHILAIADVMVTDYSSVMFDFTATRRPVVFFTPDIESYSKDGRGVYFDLEKYAPGPVIRNERALADAVRRAWSSRDSESTKYDAWVSRFNGYDDGGATERLATIVRKWL